VSGGAKEHPDQSSLTPRLRSFLSYRVFACPIPCSAARRCRATPTHCFVRSRQSRTRDQKSELYGRALVVICAEQYASRLVVPTSQRTHPTSWASHKDRARKALTKLASPHLSASLKQLEKAIAQTHADHDQAVSATRHQAAPPAGGPAADDQTDSEFDEDTLDDPDGDQGDPEQQTGE
jgi:hypothetical protein